MLHFIHAMSTECEYLLKSHITELLLVVFYISTVIAITVIKDAIRIVDNILHPVFLVFVPVAAFSFTRIRSGLSVLPDAFFCGQVYPCSNSTSVMSPLEFCDCDSQAIKSGR